LQFVDLFSGIEGEHGVPVDLVGGVGRRVHPGEQHRGLQQHLDSAEGFGYPRALLLLFDGVHQPVPRSVQ
jgi:hypothetical protein